MLSSLFNEFLPMKNLIYLGIVSILYHCYFQILYHLVELFAHDLIYVQLAIELYKHYSVTHEMVSITFDLSICHHHTYFFMCHVAEELTLQLMFDVKYHS